MNADLVRPPGLQPAGAQCGLIGKALQHLGANHLGADAGHAPVVRTLRHTQMTGILGILPQARIPILSELAYQPWLKLLDRYLAEVSINYPAASSGVLENI